MTLEQIALIAQIIGVAVVAGTLIYLALQVHQGAQQMRSEGRQAQLTYDQTGVYKFVAARTGPVAALPRLFQCRVRGHGRRHGARCAAD